MRIGKTILIGALVSIASHSVTAAPIDNAISAPARAGFVCPDTSNVRPDELTRIRTVLPIGNALDDPARLSASIAELKRMGLSRARIVDHLVGAYCPTVAESSTLSDAQKAEDVRLYAGRITAHVYGQDHVSDIVLNVLLKPSVADRVRAAAQASGVSEEKWVSTTIESALQTH